MRTSFPVVAVAVLALAACAPIAPMMPAASTGAPFPETPAESPSPVPVGSPFDAVGEEEISRLWSTGLLLPVRGVSLSKIEDSFDAPRDGGRRHDAVDILAPRGTQVVAATGGTVLRVGSNALGGNVVWMADKDQKFVYYYAHLDSYARGIRQGSTLARGAPIGSVGTTGNAPPNVPHLHFQVMRMNDVKHWWNGTPVNPWPFLVDDVPVRASTPSR